VIFFLGPDLHIKWQLISNEPFDPTIDEVLLEEEKPISNPKKSETDGKSLNQILMERAMQDMQERLNK
jgi:hypothetical protein